MFIMKLKNTNSHDRDSRIEFDEDSHTYYVDGEKYDISVTGFVHDFFPKFDARKVIKKMAMSSNWEKSPYNGMGVDEIIEMWDKNKEQAAKLGSELHRDIEFYYNELDIDNETREFEHFLEFVNDHKELEPFRTEWCIFDEDFKLAGTIDMIFKEGDDYVIYDWKRSKDIKEDNKFEQGLYPLTHLPHANYWHYSLQLNIYKKILEKKYDINISKLYLLWLHPKNDTYIKLEVGSMEKEVEELLNLRKEDLRE